SIKSIAAAMCKAQGEMGGALKGANNPFFKSKYADLGEVIKVVKEPFANNGLSFVQFPINDGDKVGVETILMHESGEWLSGSFTVKASKQDAQGAGSVITYCKRYGLQAIAGIPSEDDDGNSASNKGPTVTDMSWVNAVKQDPKNIEQITDAVYKTRIQLLIKEGY
ncbi:MAG: single-stranded DNA-binding protein, partial [bacterium]|nr:single-stranded DNA-binding protein [bacterium]